VYDLNKTLQIGLDLELHKLNGIVYTVQFFGGKIKKVNFYTCIEQLSFN
jgi:hypothetical protein